MGTSWRAELFVLLQRAIDGGAHVRSQALAEELGRDTDAQAIQRLSFSLAR
jgi:hypothetical protein